MSKLKFLFALWISKLVMMHINIWHKGKGTNYPGKLAFKYCKDFIKHFKNINYDKVIFITGTNGKSTTNNMMVHAFRNSGHTVCTNLAGANLITGIATALLRESTLTGKIKSEYCIFETDERFINSIYDALPAKNICVTNIQKDQVQRNGEPDFIYKKLKNVVGKGVRLFVNNDEPRAKSLEDVADSVVYYGLDRNDKSFVKDEIFDKEFNVTLPCPKCNHKLLFNYYNVDNAGDFKCSHCGFASNKKIKYLVKDLDLQKSRMSCNNYPFRIKFTESYFIYNYALAIAVCEEFGLTPEEIQKSFDNFKNVGGRLEDLYFGNKVLKYVRIKQENPETLQSAFNNVSEDPEEKIVMIGLMKVEDIIPNYSNTFYSFDCDLSHIKNVEKYIVLGDAVAYDTALRLKYLGVPEDKIDVIDTNDAGIILDRISKYENNNFYLITWLHQFEKFQVELADRKYRELLKKGELYEK